MAKTKKVKSTGRFGARYGRKIKLRVREIEKQSKKNYKCSECGADRVKRLSSGIWKCSRCGNKFAGPSYKPSSKVAVSKKVTELVPEEVEE
ncbi:MAG: 50S ribosomal protein L37ae [Candidatus Undinarchaeales archaeon]